MRPQLLRRALVVLACAASTLTLAACESTEHESAQIERESRAAVAAEAAKEQAAKRHAHDRASGARTHGPATHGSGARG